MPSEKKLQTSSLKLFLFSTRGWLFTLSCCVPFLLQDVVVSPTGRGQETVRKGIHVAAVGRSLKVAHDSELCSPGCKVSFLVRQYALEAYET